MPRDIGSVWAWECLCSHSRFHGEAGFVAAMQLGLGPQVGGLCCAVSWLSVPRCCGAQNQAERVKIRLIAEVAVGESKSALSPGHKELTTFAQTKGVQSGDDMSWEAVALSCYTRDLLGNSGGNKAAQGIFCHKSVWTNVFGLVWSEHHETETWKARLRGRTLHMDTDPKGKRGQMWPSFAFAW